MGLRFSRRGDSVTSHTIHTLRCYMLQLCILTCRTLVYLYLLLITISILQKSTA
jgi:hypothetical protein